MQWILINSCKFTDFEFLDFQTSIVYVTTTSTNSIPKNTLRTMFPLSIYDAFKDFDIPKILGFRSQQTEQNEKMKMFNK